MRSTCAEDDRASKRPQALRALAAVVALLMLGTQLGFAGHFAFVAHSICATHGTLHHGESTEAAGAASTEGTAQAAPGDSDSHEHDDCTTLGRPMSGPAVLAAKPDFACLLAMRAETVSISARASDPVPILSLAPKQSPPTVA